MIWKILFLLLLFFGNSVYAAVYELDKERSKLTYTLTEFGIPFKRKPLPATGKIYSDKNIVNNKHYLQGINLKVRFLSKNFLFRRVIDFDKYPYLLFSAKFEKPIAVNDSAFVNLDGYLTFHGVTKRVNVKLRCKLNNSLISLTGFLNIKMTDFGIKPPRILFIPVDNVIKTKIELLSN